MVFCFPTLQLPLTLSFVFDKVFLLNVTCFEFSALQREPSLNIDPLALNTSVRNWALEENTDKQHSILLSSSEEKGKHSFGNLSCGVSSCFLVLLCVVEVSPKGCKGQPSS